MDDWVGILSSVNLAGAIHALGQAVVLGCVRRGPRRANRVMAVFLVVLAAGMCHGVVSRAGLYDRSPWLGLLMATLPLLYGPLFYFYARAIASPADRWAPRDALHAVPFAAGLGAYVLSYSGAVRLPAWQLVLALATGQTVGYLRQIRSMLRRHEESLQSSCSTIDRLTLGWLRWRIAAYGIIWSAGIVGVAAFVSNPRALEAVSQAVFLLVALNSFLTGYRAMLHPVFVPPAEAAPAAARYARSSLTADDADRCEARLRTLMDQDKPHLDPDLTLAGLAAALGVQPAHLSRVINERLGCNFFEFVNRYRVAAARERLARPDAAREKLITVAFDAGFRSLATFNRVFKDETGRTPSEFRRQAASSS